MDTKMVWDAEYKGPRWRYGLTYRPAGFAQVPDGRIGGADHPDSRFRHGTIDYPFEVDAKSVYRFELTLVAELPGLTLSLEVSNASSRL